MLEKKLNELNIFALRDLARKTGVNSPTSKKKDELIKGIIEIMSGAKQPVVAHKKQGRPPKVFGYDFANVFNLNGLTSGKIVLNQKTENYSSEDLKTIAGWLEPVNDNSAILWVNRNLKYENFFVAKEVLNGLEIKAGDRVVAELSFEENHYAIKRIFSINGCPINQLKNARLNYSEIKHSMKLKTLNFNSEKFKNLKINKGENVYFYGANNNVNTVKILEMLNDCKVDNKMYINISLAEKNKDFFNNIKNTEMFVANIDEDVDLVRRMLNLAIERAKRVLETEEDALIVVDDMLSITSIDNDNLNFVKKLASLAKSAEKLGSITLLAIMPNERVVQIEKLADRRLQINGDIIIEKNQI